VTVGTSGLANGEGDLLMNQRRLWQAFSAADGDFLQKGTKTVTSDK
jgi:hypothetical protein